MRKVFIGVDVGMDKLDVSISLDGQKYDTLQIFNNEGSILGFFDYLKTTYKKSDFYFGYEATSNYMHVLQRLVHNNDFKQIMVNPYVMAHYLKHLNSRTKNDKIDSIGIAKFIQTIEHEDFKTIFNQDDKTLRKYTSSINLLRKLDTQLKNLIHSQKENPIELLDSLLKTLLLKIKETKKGLDKEAEKVLKELFPHVIELKNQIKGVGYALLLELIPIFLKSQNYTLKQLQSFVGLSPRIFQSGSSVHKRESMSKRGSSLVRKLLYLCTMSAIQHNQIIKEKYNRLVDGGKNKMVALVACMSHLFRAVYVKFHQGLVNV
ncbi:IS110 family transposase [Sulfurospirillum multivorans]|uniref:Transposase n=2 Tax=Sulfurospirillum multivorans TaxID=66821 RepID=A0AA86AMT8_SULMK|nr:IS110 family transposase [Sulfurospirillum multivorans]AHJ12328.1 putative transposase [Sulfurospirillum multivorans DSM 12446]QEH05828.1 putative transposase [Sulfurospirillum multivorans]